MVPSGVSLCAAGPGATAALITIPELTPPRSGPPTTGSSRLPRLAPVRPRGPVAASRRAGHRQGRDPQPDPLVQGPGDVDRGPALAGEGRIGPDRAVVCASAGNFGQGVAYAARALGVPAVMFASRNANRARSSGCARSAPRSSRWGRTSTRPVGRRRRTPPSTRPSCSSTATTRGSRPAPRPWPSS